jgi:hypothetical protein
MHQFKILLNPDKNLMNQWCYSWIRDEVLLFKYLLCSSSCQTPLSFRTLERSWRFWYGSVYIMSVWRRAYPCINLRHWTLIPSRAIEQSWELWSGSTNILADLVVASRNYQPNLEYKRESRHVLKYYSQNVIHLQRSHSITHTDQCLKPYGLLRPPLI